MQEVWVKKTIWRRYLIDDNDVGVVKEILEHDEHGDKIISDCYDKNKLVEYDNEDVILPYSYEIKAI